MSLHAWIILFALLWLAFAWCARQVTRHDIRGDTVTGIFVFLLRVYCRVVHGLRVVGKENIPLDGPESPVGPLIVVANHTSGADPLLIQAACPFEIRWMMAEDMRIRWAEPLWQWVGIIFVDRRQKRTLSARIAIRRLEERGVLGVFPEGRIERPQKQILPFMHGVGLLVARTKTPVLPVIINGVPPAPRAWSSLWRPSRARVRFMPVIHYEDRKLKPDQIADDLRRRYLEWTGWPANDKVPAEAMPPY